MAKATAPRLVLDTTVLIDSFKRQAGHASSPDLLPLLRRVNLSCSIVSAYEFLHAPGGILVAEILERQDWLRNHRIDRLPLDRKTSSSFEALINRPCPPRLPDTLIAATCIARRLPLVTGNPRDFEVVQQLQLIDLP